MNIDIKFSSRLPTETPQYICMLSVTKQNDKVSGRKRVCSWNESQDVFLVYKFLFGSIRPDEFC
jgi:hypothetical protein